MIGVVRDQAFQLLAHRHDARRSAGTRWAVDRLLKSRNVAGGEGCLFQAAEEPLPQLIPRFELDFVPGGKPAEACTG